MKAPEISRELLEHCMNRSVAKVSDTMLSQSIEAAKPEDLSEAKVDMPIELHSLEKPIYVGSVGFVGDINGVVYLTASQSVMEKATARITGSDKAGTEMVSDVCGEIANMLGGGFKNALADKGHVSTLTIPTVLNGCDLYVSSIGVSLYLRFRYTLFGERIIVDLAMAKIV